MDEGETLIAVVSDWHCGSKWGLLPPSFLSDDDEQYPQNTFQKWIWRKWVEYWDEVERQAESAKRVKLFVVGDQVQGPNHRDVELVSADVGIHEEIAAECLSYIVDRLELEPSQCHFWRGTESHVAPAAKSERNVVKAVFKHGQAPRVYYRRRLSVDKVEIDVKHHSSRSGREYTRGGGIRRETSDVIMGCGKRRRLPPHLIIRAHVHVVEDTGPEFHEVRGITCPCWQLSTAYGHKITSMSPEVGGWIIRTSGDGQYTAEVIRDVLPSEGRTVKI